MSMKINVPWQIRMPAVKSRSPRSRSWWNRKHFNENQSAPLRSITMKEDDLDHLGAMHHVSDQKNKPKRFRKWF